MGRDQELTGWKCKVAWVRVCAPTIHGGAGITDLEKISRALRIRWLWYSWDERERPWKGLELPIEKDDIALFHAVTKVEIGNGEKASFWSSRWLQGQAPATLYPTLFNHSKRKNRTVKDAITDNRWVRDLDHNMTVTIITEFTELWSKIQGTLLLPEQEDSITWLHTADGCYTARPAYLLQFAGRTSSLTADITWKTKAPPKCRFFTWLMLQNRIWTTARLQVRGWPNDYFCQFCIRNLETVHHLFQECCFSKLIWSKVGSWISAADLKPENWNQTEDL